MSENITLTPSQQNAFDKIVAFVVVGNILHHKKQHISTFSLIIADSQQFLNSIGQRIEL